MSLTQEIIRLAIYFIFQSVLAMTLFYLFVYRGAMHDSYKHVGIHRPVLIEKAISLTMYASLALFFLIGLFMLDEVFG